MDAEGRAFALGDTVKDRITGFEGVAIARSEYLDGTRSVCIQGRKLIDGIPAKLQWVDVARVSLVVGGYQDAT